MGESLGPYDLQDELGRGGMGVVYRAVHRPTGAVRALKVLNLAPGAEAMERFRREAAALARAQGEGVVPVHDLGVANGRMFFAMPLLEGGSLQARLASSGPWAWRDACALVLEVARALERCHAALLVHRDLKPANVLFDATGHVHLADFGCVRDVAAPRLTQTGALLGTPSYMAPELFSGGKADARSDVYALGAILYELVTGHAPYRATSAVQVFSLATERRRAPLPASAPRALEALVTAALEPKPEGRVASASELAARLERLLAGPEVGRGSRWLPAVAATGVAAVVVVVALVELNASAPPAPSAPLPPAPPPRTQTAPTPPAAPVEEFAGVRRVLRRGLTGRDLVSALDHAMPATPATVDSALALQLVAAVWPGEDRVLAAEVFGIAARADELVPQPLGLVEALSYELFMNAQAPVGVLTGLLRLGRRPSGKQVVRYEDELRARLERGASWADELALAHVLNEQARDGKFTAPAAEIAERRELGLKLARQVDTFRIPRGARAAARLIELQHRCAGSREGLVADLPRLMEFAADLDAPRGAYVQAAELVLDAGELRAARPYIDAALLAHAERNVPTQSDVTMILRPDRPWVAPVPPESGRSDDISRLEAFVALVDGHVEQEVLVSLVNDLSPVARDTLARQLAQVGRSDEAARVGAVVDALKNGTPPPR